MASYAEYLKKALKDDEEKRKAASAAEKTEAVAVKPTDSVPVQTSAASAYMSEETLAEELNKIDDMYKSPGASSLPDPVEYDRLEYDAPTDEEIAEHAASALESYRQSGIADIEKDAANRLEDKQSERTEAQKTAENAAAEAVGFYDKAITDFANDALKRGLARSSIAVNKSERLQSDKARALTDIGNNAAAEIARIDSEINTLQSDMQKALADFDIAYAARLTEKIAELKAEREEKQTEALKYNNSLTEKEREDQLDLIELGNKLSETEGTVPEEKLSEFYKAKYDVIRAYLSGLEPDKASREIKNNALIRNSVSDYYYYRLYNEFAGDTLN